MNFSNFRNTALGLAAIIALAACGDEQNMAPVQQAMQATPVEVAQVISAQVSNWQEFTGTTVAPEQIDLRPRVSGYLNKVHFQEGSQVNEGDLLFSIDAAPFLAEVARLDAELIIAQSQKTLAEKEYKRAQKLTKQNAISAELLDARSASLQQASARINSVKAALLQAELQLDYTQITAPIAGVISNAYITKGNFVTAGTSVLTSLVSNDKLHAYFDANQATYLQYARAKKQASAMPVLISLGNLEGFDIEGEIDFIDNRIDPSTGTIRARALIENNDALLVPGLFTRLRVYDQVNDNTVLIDDKAVATDLSNKYVLVLNKDNHVEYRAISLGAKLNGLRIVESGLNGDESIVVNGLQRVRPGAQVEPQTVEMTSAENYAKLKADQSTIQALRHALDKEPQDSSTQSELVLAKKVTGFGA